MNLDNMQVLQEDIEAEIDSKAAKVEWIVQDGVYVPKQSTTEDQIFSANGAKDGTTADDSAASLQASSGFFAASSLWDDSPFSGFIQEEDEEKSTGLSQDSDTIRDISHAEIVDNKLPSGRHDSDEVLEALLPSFTIFMKPKVDPKISKVVPDSENSLFQDSSSNNDSEEKTLKFKHDVVSAENSNIGTITPPPLASQQFDFSPTPTRVTVAPNSSRFWSVMSGAAGAAISATTSRPLFFDNDDDINLDDDPIMKQVKENKNNPSGSGLIKMPALINDFLRPFRIEKKSKVIAENNLRSSALPIHSNDILPNNTESMTSKIIYFAKSFGQGFVVLVVCLWTAALPYLTWSLVALSTLLSRMYAQLSSNVNARGEIIGSRYDISMIFFAVR